MLWWLPILMCVGIIANGLRLRGRLRRLDTVPASGRPVDPRHEFLVARDVRLTAAARRAVSNHASRERLRVLDLIPADLPVERALDVARMVDTRTYRSDRGAAGRGAFQAILADAELLDRAGIHQREGFDPVELVDIIARLKNHATIGTDLVVVPGLSAARDDPVSRARVQKRTYRGKPLNLLAPTFRDIAMVCGGSVNLRWALVATVLFWLQPFFVCAGRVPLRPRDLARSPVVRILAGVAFVIAAARNGRRTAAQKKARKSSGLSVDGAKKDTRIAAVRCRDSLQHRLGEGIETLLEPVRETCPWCGSPDLVTRLESRDLQQRKPGRFRLQRCRGCGHVFVNPRLTNAGSDFFGRDHERLRDGFPPDSGAYPGDEHNNDCDGVHKDLVGGPVGYFSGGIRVYRERAEMQRPFAAPRSWLDVGTGSGRFCDLARDIWPDTVFDGLDTSPGVTEAGCRGWVDHAFRGTLADRAPELGGRYDVVSMFRYLEYVRDPYLELDLAAKTLVAGGYLLLELPNTQCPAAGFLGRFWVGWSVPRHLHLPTPDNLTAALAERGLRPVALRFGRVHRPGDLTAAVHLALQWLAPDPRSPWLPDGPTGWRRLRRGSALVLATPLFLAAAAMDFLLQPVFHGGRRANAFRVVARKDF
ncbi:class I SAM-dependent methyltransferase [Frankia sp. Cr2]|uniref:class I SAM-dependent methyltransferase n=1 Tax=Frankia sp. Cr2 TaxID=3073932 RepID=UPI002AD3BE98|nr:class I SAM-dependent methyltransferase [Frankia sp. Cr2]